MSHSFIVTSSDLSRHARKKKIDAWLSALTYFTQVFAHAEDPADIQIRGTCYLQTRPATYVPYGSTSAMLHDSYDEVEDVEVDQIIWDSPNPEEINLNESDPKKLQDLEALVRSYLDVNQDELTRE